MDHPHVILRVHGNGRHVAKHLARRQRRKLRIHFESRHSRRRLRLHEVMAGDPRRQDGEQPHDRETKSLIHVGLPPMTVS
jgi:hypothetical protein